MIWFWTLLALLVVVITGLAFRVHRRDRGRQQAAEPAGLGHPQAPIPARRDTGLDSGWM